MLPLRRGVKGHYYYYNSVVSENDTVGMEAVMCVCACEGCDGATKSGEAVA